MAVGVNDQPKPRSVKSKFFSIARTDTTASIKAWLPKDSFIVGLFIIGSAPSNAGTTAFISIGTSDTSTELLPSYDVKSTTSGKGFSQAGATVIGSALATRITVDTPIYAKYTETGTASSAGAWTIRIDYFVGYGPGDLING